MDDPVPTSPGIRDTMRAMVSRRYGGAPVLITGNLPGSQASPNLGEQHAGNHQPHLRHLRSRPR